MKRQLAVSSAVATLLLAACGGSSSSSPPPPPASPGAATKALTARGAITAKGAGTLTVNGLVLDTSAATFRVEKQQKTEAEIHHGMVVRVKGTIDDRGAHKATEVEFEDHVKGRSADDVLAGFTTVTVGGRTVHIEDSTKVLDDHGVDIAPDAIKRDDRLRVSGFADALGRLHATSIERLATASADDSFEAKGFVTAIAAGRTSFDLSLTLGGPLAWTVTLASGTLNPAVGVGSYVEVHATARAVGTTVTADLVTLDDHKLGDPGAETEVEGIVISGTSASFMVDDVVVLTSAGTRWENGAAADLQPGVKVEAEGHIDGSGNLVAEKVSFRESSRLQGTVAGTPGAYTILGFPLTLADTADGAGLLVAAAFVEVRGYPRSNGQGLVVTRVKTVNSGSPKSFIQGPVAAVDAGARSLQILGVTITAATGASFNDHHQAFPDAAAFFAKVVAGRSVVKARVAAAPVASAATSDELELEDEPAAHP